MHILTNNEDHQFNQKENLIFVLRWKWRVFLSIPNTQKLHAPDLRSFIHCFIYKLHLMSSWAHLNRDKLIAWEFFHPACITSARLLDGQLMRPMLFKKSWNLFYSNVVGVQSDFLVLTEIISRGHWIWNLLESKNNVLASWGYNK